MSRTQRCSVYALLLVVALGFRLFIALRYVVEIFPFLIILAGAGASVLKASGKATASDSDSDVPQTAE